MVCFGPMPHFKSLCILQAGFIKGLCSSLTIKHFENMDEALESCRGGN